MNSNQRILSGYKKKKRERERRREREVFYSLQSSERERERERKFTQLVTNRFPSLFSERSSDASGVYIHPYIEFNYREELVIVKLVNMGNLTTRNEEIVPQVIGDVLPRQFRYFFRVFEFVLFLSLSLSLTLSLSLSCLSPFSLLSLTLSFSLLSYLFFTY